MDINDPPEPNRPDLFRNIYAPPEFDRANLFHGVVAGVVMTVIFGIGGFFLVYDDQGYMGTVLFLLVPFVAGFATALVARGRNVITSSLILGLLFCTAILLLTGFEGVVCVIMSAPLIAVGLTIGALIGWMVRVYIVDRSGVAKTLTLLLLLVIPIFLMGANRTEESVGRNLRTQTVSDTLVVDYAPETVWNELKSMESINASKTFLMKIGLPVPVSCQTEGEGIGGKRTCYFEHGFIEERITEWNFPRSMKFEIVAFDVPGRPWLSFKDASYDIQRVDNRTVITRKTTIVSRLSPAWYWRRLEAIGVHTEHHYLFEGLANSLNEGLTK
jgi:hypothetical protein